MNDRYSLIEELSQPYAQLTGKSVAVAKEALNNMTSSEIGLVRDRCLAQGYLRLSQSDIAQAETAARRLLNVNQRLAEAVVDRAADQAMFQAELDSRRIPEQQAQAKELEQHDRAIFAWACREFLFANVEANFVALKDKFPGQPLRMDEIQLAFDSDELSNLIPATPAETQQYQAERVEEYNRWLKSLDEESLRRIARENGRAVQRSSEWQTYQARRMKEMLEPPPPPLPWRNPQTGELWDAAFFRRMGMTDVPLFTKFVKKYRSQITARLNGLDKEI